AFDVNGGDLVDRRSAITNRLYYIDNCVERRRRRSQQEGSRSAARMEIADSPKRLLRGFHRVAPDRAVRMKIDKARREVISVKIGNIICGSVRLLPDLRNFPLLRNDFQAVTNSIRENQASI